MPSGRKGQTKRNDGGKSRVCVYCEGVGCRCRAPNGGWAHRRCIPKQRSISIEQMEKDWREEGLTGPRITSKTSMGHIKTARFGLNKEKS